jgi:hypothetical protein
VREGEHQLECRKGWRSQWKRRAGRARGCKVGAGKGVGGATKKVIQRNRVKYLGI